MPKRAPNDLTDLELSVPVRTRKRAQGGSEALWTLWERHEDVHVQRVEDLLP